MDISWITETAYGRAFSLGFIIMLLYAPYCLCKGVLMLNYGDKLSSTELLKCWIPIYNKFQSDEYYYGRMSWGAGSIGGLLLVVIRVVVSFLTNNITIYHISAIGMLIGIAIWYLCNVGYSISILIGSKMIGKGTAILWSLIYPLGFWYFTNRIVVETNRLAKNKFKKGLK